MKKNRLVVVLAVCMTSCDVHHEKTWVIKDAPIGGGRRKTVESVILRESKRAGLMRGSGEGAKLSFYYQINENTNSTIEVLTAHGVDDEVIVNLDSGFNPNVSKTESFFEFRRSIDKLFKSEIGEQHIK